MDAERKAAFELRMIEARYDLIIALQHIKYIYQMSDSEMIFLLCEYIINWIAKYQRIKKRMRREV